MSVAGWQMRVLEEQEVSELRTLVVVVVAVRDTDFSEGSVMSGSVLIIKVPQNYYIREFMRMLA